MTFARRRAVAVPAVLVLAALATACQTSPKVTVDKVTSTSPIRCSLGQSYVMESTDDDPAQYGGGTDAWTGSDCAAEDTGTFWWDRLEVYARKYNGNTLCDTSPVASTTTNRSVAIDDRYVCASGGSSHIWVMGTHGSARPAYSVTYELSTTPEVVSS